MKRHSRFIIAAVLPAGGGLSLTACTDNEVVADVGGHKITRAELKQKAQGQPLKVRDEYYRAERDALNKVIDDYLIEQKAKEKHLTVEQLIKRDIESHVQDPTEDRSVEALLQRRWTDEPYSAVRDNILAYIRQCRVAKAPAEYVKALRDKAMCTSVWLRRPQKFP